MSASANLTSLAHAVVPYLTHDGHDVVVVIVKGTYAVSQSGDLHLAGAQRPVALSESFSDPEATASSLLEPHDVVPEKPFVDVVAVGHAISGKPVEVIDVSLGFRDRAYELKVHGPRRYQRSATAPTIGNAAPTTKEAITWENAFGGMGDSDATTGSIEQRNPAGRGMTKRPQSLIGKPAPQIEHTNAPLGSANDRPAPAGLGPLPAWWRPRAGYTGTTDEAWKQNRMPLMPDDFDVRAYQSAPTELQFDKPVKAAEAIVVAGMTEGADPWLVTLPEWNVVVDASYGDGNPSVTAPAQSKSLEIDTIFLRPDDREIELSGRVTFLIGRADRRLKKLLVRAG